MDCRRAACDSYSHAIYASRPRVLRACTIAHSAGTLWGELTLPRAYLLYACAHLRHRWTRTIWLAFSPSFYNQLAVQVEPHGYTIATTPGCWWPLLTRTHWPATHYIPTSARPLRAKRTLYTSQVPITTPTAGIRVRCTVRCAYTRCLPVARLTTFSPFLATRAAFCYGICQQHYFHDGQRDITPHSAYWRNSWH